MSQSIQINSNKFKSYSPTSDPLYVKPPLISLKYPDGFNAKNPEEYHIPNCMKTVKPETVCLNRKECFQIQGINNCRPEPEICNKPKEVPPYKSAKAEFPFFIEFYETRKESCQTPCKYLIQRPRTHAKK